MRRAGMQETVPLAAGIFLDVINTFLFFLQLFGRRDSRGSDRSIWSRAASQDAGRVHSTRSSAGSGCSPRYSTQARFTHG